MILIWIFYGVLPPICIRPCYKFRITLLFIHRFCFVEMHYVSGRVFLLIIKKSSFISDLLELINCLATLALCLYAMGVVCVFLCVDLLTTHSSSISSSSKAKHILLSRMKWPLPWPTANVVHSVRTGRLIYFFLAVSPSSFIFIVLPDRQKCDLCELNAEDQWYLKF